MICGGAKKDLEDAGVLIGMASPTVFAGKGTELAQISKSQAITIPFKTAEGEFVVDISLAFNED